MKKKLLLFFFSICYLGISQISVSEKPNQKSKEFNEDTLARLKKTQTIFILPDIIDKKDYQEILQKHWKITPYKFVNHNEFDFFTYLDDKYSFVYLNTNVNTIEKSRAINVYINTSLDFFMLDNSKAQELITKNKKDSQEIIEKSKLPIASIKLYPKNQSLRTIANARNDMASLEEISYTKETFYDFKIGFFKNGIQKINSQLLKEEPYNLYQSDHLSEIKNLADKKLYVPEYIGIQFNGMRETHRGKQKSHIEELFKNYNYQYTIINCDDLSNKIMGNEIDYYIKYTRINTQRFLNVVNAKTGEIVYRNHMPGLAYNLHAKHVFNLNNTIRKTSENL